MTRKQRIAENTYVYKLLIIRNLPSHKQRKARLVEKYIYVVNATSWCLLYEEGYHLVEATMEICVNLLCIEKIVLAITFISLILRFNIILIKSDPVSVCFRNDRKFNTASFRVWIFAFFVQCKVIGFSSFCVVMGY